MRRPCAGRRPREAHVAECEVEAPDRRLEVALTVIRLADPVMDPRALNAARCVFERLLINHDRLVEPPEAPWAAAEHVE